MGTLVNTYRKIGKRFGVFFLLYILAIAVAIVGNVLVMRLTGDMGEAAAYGRSNDIIRLVWIVTAITGVRALASAVSALTLGRFAAKTEFKTREYFAKYFLALPFSALEKKNSGEMLSVYTNDVPQAAQFVTRGVLMVITELLSAVVSLVFMFSIHWLFTLIFIGMFPVLVLMQALMAKPIQQIGVERSEEEAKFNAVVNDSLQNTSTIVAYSLTDTMEERYMAAYDRYFAKFREFILIMGKLVITGVFATQLPTTVLIAMAAGSTINGNMEISEYIALVSIGMVVGSWLSMLSQQMGGVGIMSASAVRVDNETSDEVAVAVSGRVVSDADTVVRFENVSFSYGEENRALDGVSFEIKRGEKVAFVGESGSGKSTALKLILGLYEPGEGQIFAADGAFAYVPQDNFLFPESIGANIAFASGADDALRSACANAGILEFIENLPEKFDTVLAEAAENVSGGQKQRIAIARAFYMDAPVVLFDEATSSLDPIIEAQILETMEGLMDGRTVIMVAHRENTIAACDRVIYFENGRVRV